MAGNVRNYPFFSGLVVPKVVVDTLVTAGNVTYTAAQVWDGEIHRDPNGSNRTDTLPSAHDLVTARPGQGVEIGSTIEIVIRNDADAAETITVAAGAGGTTSGTMTIAQNAANRFRIRFTNIDYPTEAYEVSGLTAAAAAGGAGDALVANPLSQFAATTSAQLRGVISDETGTGVAVFNNGPTILLPAIASFANAGHTHLDSAGGGTLTLAAISDAAVLSANTQTANYVAVLGDAGKVIEMNVGSGNTFTVPPNSSVAFSVGTIIEVYQMGAGQTTITEGAGVTFRKPRGAKTGAQYATASLRKRATDEWVVSGDVTT